MSNKDESRSGPQTVVNVGPEATNQKVENAVPTESGGDVGNRVAEPDPLTMLFSEVDSLEGAVGAVLAAPSVDDLESLSEEQVEIYRADVEAARKLVGNAAWPTVLGLYGMAQRRNKKALGRLR